MTRLKKNIKRLLMFLMILAAFIYLNNTSLFIKDHGREPLLLAHRGMAQTFSMEGIEWDTCTAERIYEPEHPYLENTIPSIRAAFEAGADIVEFDIKRTKDDQFAVFHDATLECRTNAAGEPSEYTMDELKQLDIGYGYTADGGKTFPFRGKGIGLMPSMTEVLSQFPKHELLIHIKSNSHEDGELLVRFLEELPREQLKLITVYGDNEPIQIVKEKLPELRVMSLDTMKSCLLPYIAVGWTGYVPSACENTQLHIPEKYAPYLWGFPNKFLKRMEEAHTRVILVAGDGDWSEGFDREEDLDRLPKNYNGGIWTNRIDIISPIIKK
ncbi:MAG TPA: glycerophosphodiester phosphodiesterase family protein [Bacillus sp. (in: firmicutes)]|uniref:glycerophosphodiester phosphodiesterase family protein n=1 Tax=Bacillus litorisediminis TaxID=2922713 RepID=UPI001FAD2855|nr:glycerophosphodiester phosphodiesterase family protein [Bacillus litorisediminis]HWO74520.1 glycerophosphodiester phosphodiesterase family protein [Bacillus sp. (in: firmicutes)]